ncbi:MAG: hypothetical protein LBV74_12305 [Tannerella sp.]|jgi:hypothetical protein|nr:hypothetical protein [Tannerella sp.]
MILGFKTRYPEWMTKKGWDTFFEDKIKAGIKIHTIRQGHRFKPGDKLHLATGVRTKNYNCFKEMVCTYTQEIELDRNFGYGPMDLIINIDGHPLRQLEKETLAMKDGFDTYQDFVEWFNQKDEKFIGQIIHWTDFKYRYGIVS